MTLSPQRSRKCFKNSSRARRLVPTAGMLVDFTKRYPNGSPDPYASASNAKTSYPARLVPPTQLIMVSIVFTSHLHEDLHAESIAASRIRDIHFSIIPGIEKPITDIPSGSSNLISSKQYCPSPPGFAPFFKRLRADVISSTSLFHFCLAISCHIWKTESRVKIKIVPWIVTYLARVSIRIILPVESLKTGGR